MIRFCEGRLNEININSYTAETFKQYITVSGFENYVLRLSDNEKMIGDFVWDDILLVSDLNEMKISKHIKCGEDIFSQIRLLWSNSPSGRENGRHLFVPIYDAHDNFLCVAFDDAYENGEHNNDRNAINYFKVATEYQTISLSDIFPNIKLYRLYGVDELQYSFYKYLKKYNLPYQLVGSQWKMVGAEDYISEFDVDHNSDSEGIYEIYADDMSRKKLNISDSSYYTRNNYLFEKYYKFCARLCMLNYVNEVKIASEYLESHNISVGCVKFPDAKELGQTENEAWCYHNQLSLHFFRWQTDYKYLQNILQVYGEELVIKHKKGKTQEGRFLQIVEECNLQYVTNERKKNKILLIGPCVVRQEELMTEDTLVAQLQKMLDSEGYSYCVYGLTVPIEKYNKMQDALKTMYFYEGDIVIFCNMNLKKECAKYYLDLLPLFKTRNEERWFTDTSIHLNQVGTKRVAERVYNFIDCIRNENKSGETIMIYPTKIDYEKEKWIISYINKWKDVNEKNSLIGSIVMNCNPYTKGHDYLIRYAASKVDILYVFLVEEDVSLFSFKSRYEMAKLNTSDIENVKILPSGKAILSLMTLPTYFSKGSFQNVQIDASEDLSLFALGIAPGFNISVRFVGEEPKDNITAQYNNWMKKVLPYYGIEVVEVPRLTAGDNIVSASSVRDAIRRDDIDLLKEQLTDISFKYLMK